MRIPAQTSSSIAMDLSVPNAWTGSSGQGTYRLALQDQPTINPTTATVTNSALSGGNEPLKANGLPPLISRLPGLGFGATVVSAGEVDLARRAGFPAATIALEGIGNQLANRLVVVGADGTDGGDFVLRQRLGQVERRALAVEHDFAGVGHSTGRPHLAHPM